MYCIFLHVRSDQYTYKTWISFVWGGGRRGVTAVIRDINDNMNKKNDTAVCHSLRVTTLKIRYTQAGGSDLLCSGSHCPTLRICVLKWIWPKLIHYQCIQWEQDVSKVWHRQKEECETQSVLSVGQKGDMWLLDTVYITLCHHHIFMVLLHYKEEPFWYLWKNQNMIQQSWCKKAVLRFPVIFCVNPWGSFCFWIASHSYVFVLVLQNRSQKQSRLLLAVQQLNDNTEMAKNPEE